ncbi:hypothetical protein EDC04DRAFT_2601907 [Pisolithus marmoratus]|nr:hypothetical protein EDC04DRAFT_2601907 [Pisolithus marmoratus]
MKRSATSALQATSKARRLLSPNPDFEEEEDVYEPDILTEEEEDEQEDEVVGEDPNALDAPSQEVGPTSSIAPFTRHPKGVTPIKASSTSVCLSIMGYACTQASHVAHGAFPFPPAEPCAILSGLGLEYTTWGFLCRTHHTLVHPRHLCCHINNKRQGHGPGGGHLGGCQQRVFLDHILQAFGLSSEDIEFPLPQLPLTTLPGLIPSPAYACPVPNCTTFSKLSTAKGDDRGLERPLWSHIRQYHGPEVAREYRSRHPILSIHYILLPYWTSMSTSEPGANFTLVFHPNFKPSDPHAVPVPQITSTPAISAEWLQKLGWGRWKEGLGADTTQLRGLIAISVALCHLTSQWEGHHLRLEIAIFMIHHLMRGYLEDANESKAHYNQLTQPSYNAYCYALSRPIALLLRVLHLQTCDGPTGGGGLGELPDMILRMLSVTSTTALFDLYGYIMDVDLISFDPKSLLGLSHALLSSLVCCELTDVKKVECPTDVVLVLACMQSDGTFQWANRVTHQLVEASLDMFIPNKASFYHPSLEKLIPCSPAELLQHVVDTSEEEEEEEEDLGGQEEDVEKDLERDTENGAPDLELESEEGQGPSSPTAELDHAARGKVSRTECGPSSNLMLMKDGEGLIMYLPSGQPLHILFSELEFSAHQAILSLEEEITSCLPPDYAREWLQALDAKILPALVASLALTLGIPPRAFQWKSFLVDHDNDEGRPRSFFILEGYPSLANPKAKQHNRMVQECLWVAPKVIGHALSYFLGVIKPVASKVMRGCGLHHPIYDTHIFACSIPLASGCSTGQSQEAVVASACLLGGTAVNRSLESHTQALAAQNIKLSCGMLWNILTAVFHHFFPSLMTILRDDMESTKNRSAVDDQGQHETATSNTYYGRLLSVPVTLNMSRVKALGYIRTSHALHAFYGLDSPTSDWEEDGLSLKTVPYFAAKCHESVALLVACSMVCSHYGVGGGGPEAIHRNMCTVDKVLAETPYMANTTPQAHAALGYFGCFPTILSDPCHENGVQANTTTPPSCIQLSHSVGPSALAPVLGGEKSLIVICKLPEGSSVPIWPDLEEEEEDADVDPDAPSWEVGPEAGEGIFERMTTTVSKCQPSIAPFRRHPNGVTPTSDAGKERLEVQMGMNTVSLKAAGQVASPAPFATNHFLPKANAILTRGGNHLQKVKAAWIGPEGTLLGLSEVIGSVPPSEPDQQDGEPCPEEDKEWSSIDEGQQEQEAHPTPTPQFEEEAQNKAKAQEEEEESEEEGHNKAKGQEPCPYKIFSTTMNYYEEESEGQDHKDTTNFDQKGKRKAIIMEDEDEEDEDVNVNVDVDMGLDLDVDEDEDEQEQEQEWEQEHKQEQEQEQEQEELPSGFLYHPYLDTINLKMNWEFRFFICEVCKEAIKK